MLEMEHNGIVNIKEKNPYKGKYVGSELQLHFVRDECDIFNLGELHSFIMQYCMQV